MSSSIPDGSGPAIGTDRIGMARIGMSGWVYPPWRGVFYPAGLRQRDELEYAASRVTSIEINGSFYGPQKPATWERWRDATPVDFMFSVKAPRFITHLKRLRDVDGPLADFLASGLLALGHKLGPILWQLPPNLPFDPVVVERFLERLPRTARAALALAQGRDERMTGREWLGPVADRPLRHAMEVRNPTFDDERFFAMLRRYSVASVLADTAGKWPQLDWETADFSYVRLHGDTVLYESGYDDASLDRWAERVDGWRRRGRDVFVYFDNDVKVRAPIDAIGLLRRVR